jgi:hypothetical protein
VNPAKHKLDGRAITIGNLTEKMTKRLKFNGVGNTNKNSTYRGFWYIQGHGGYRCEHVVWWMFLGVPKRFKWMGTVDTMRIYIDAWYVGDRKTTARYEQEGKVVDIEMPDDTDPQIAKRIRVSAPRLVAALALQDEFDVPLWGTTAFITNGNYLVPCAFVNQLIALDPVKFGHLNPNDKWERATTTHLAKMGLKPGQVTSGMYRSMKPAPAQRPTSASSEAVAAAAAPAADYDDDQAEVAEEQPQSPPRERTISRRDRIDYIEWLTEIEYEGQRPYFCRRLYRDQRAMYEATSFNMNGPWTVYLRDNNALLALGIDP